MEYSLIPAHPRTRGLGVAFGFLHSPPALLQNPGQQNQNAPSAGNRWECGWRSLWKCPGPWPAGGTLALAPGEPWALSCCCRSSANLSGSTKVVFPAGRGSPTLLEGPRPPMLLESPAGGSQLLLQPRSVLIANVPSCISCSCLYESRNSPLEWVRRSERRGFCARGDSASLKPFGSAGISMGQS